MPRGYSKAKGRLRAPTMVEIGWAAGFIDGDGHIRFGTTPVIRVSQKDPAALKRLQEMFGGSLYKGGRSGFKGYRQWLWQCAGSRAASIMMTIYPLMSPQKQKQIRDTLTEWRDR